MSSITRSVSAVNPVRPFAAGLSITHEEARMLITTGKGREGAVIRAAYHGAYADYQRTCRSSVDAGRIALRQAIVALETFRTEKTAIIDRFARDEPTAADRAWWAQACEPTVEDWDEYHDERVVTEPTLEGCDHWGGSGHADLG